MRILLALILGAIPVLVFAQESRVASFYTERPDAYLGKKITVNCAYVKRADEVGGFVYFRALTATRRDSKSSFIYVRVPKEKADAFSRKYGFSLKDDNQGETNTRPLSGLFLKEGTRFTIDYSPS